MTKSHTPRIGFACKWIDHADQIKGIKPTDDCKRLNTNGTTVAWLNRQTRAAAEQKLWDLMKSNIESIHQLVKRVGTLHEHLRMVRLGSDLLPVYTERNWSYFWRQPDVRLYAEREFAKVGLLARDRGVRLSFHPGQFVVLASDNPDIVSRSIAEFEYHVDMARWMGYGKTFQDYKINVHISGRQGPEGIRKVLGLLTPEARNCIAIENEENAWGLEDVLTISDVVPITLDIHHHWVRSGEYIRPTDDRVLRVLDSWRGVRPTCHYSVSREDWLTGHCPDTLPDMVALKAVGFNKQKLRAHSDWYWNSAVNDWAAEFIPDFDIMCESKAKILASREFASQYLSLIDNCAE
jgi:UV DNA damage repair endonuclease